MLDLKIGRCYNFKNERMNKMDTFVEQLVKISFSKKTVILQISVWVICVLMALGFIVLSVLHTVAAFFLLILAAGCIFAAYYLTSQLNIEYEYIFTNGEIDIDRITNRSKRQRLANFKCTDIENIEIYDKTKHVPNKAENKNVYFGCNAGDDVYAFRIKHPRHGYYTLVLAPNNEFKEALRKFLPYQLKKNI